MNRRICDHCTGAVMVRDGTDDIICPSDSRKHIEELEAENEQLKKDNRRMLLLIAVMEKMLGVELTELI